MYVYYVRESLLYDMTCMRPTVCIPTVGPPPACQPAYSCTCTTSRRRRRRAATIMPLNSQSAIYTHRKKKHAR